ncbi:MAG: PrsW family intramembrane metalloprotease [Erysipelotrichaceae bacterium]|nr:PrsW family intramembrane metalloprotease [Erysipelotrichaceae bacterium]MBQ2657114.1 PrsW family intramembrane metalloprotease [Erysipelotrichaceae bacterium]
MAVMVLVLLASFIPSVLLFLFLRKNKDDEDYRKTCDKLLWQGVLIALGVTLLDAAIVLLWNLTGLGGKNRIVDLLFKTFVVNATAEETVKFLYGRKYVRKDLAKVSRLDVITYMAIAAMGFGLFEDILYMFQTNIGQILVRGFLMGHVGYGMMMGRLYGKGMKEDKMIYKVLALLIPILMHGLYNFSLGEGLPDAFAFVVVTETFITTVFLIYMIFFIRKKRNDPEFTEPIYKKEETVIVDEQ